MKFQWSIQSSHTQLVLSQVVYLNYRNEHIWPSTRKWLQIFKTFHLASLQIITFDDFLNNTSYFEIGAWNFWYFNIENKFLAFWASYISIQVMLSSKELGTNVLELHFEMIALENHWVFEWKWVFGCLRLEGDEMRENK